MSEGKERIVFVTLDEAIAILNKVVERDASAMTERMAHRVFCDRAVVKDTSIQAPLVLNNFSGDYLGGLLDIRTGMFGVGTGYTYIMAIFDYVCPNQCKNPRNKELEKKNPVCDNCGAQFDFILTGFEKGERG